MFMKMHAHAFRFKPLYLSRLNLTLLGNRQQQLSLTKNIYIVHE